MGSESDFRKSSRGTAAKRGGKRNNVYHLKLLGESVVVQKCEKIPRDHAHLLSSSCSNDLIKELISTAR